MRDEFANRQAMHLTVLNILDQAETKAVWENQSPTRFTTKATEFRTKVTALTTTIAKQTNIITGLAIEKEREEEELEYIAHELGSVFGEYLNDNNREGEAGEFDISLTKWRALREPVLLAKCKLLETRLSAAIASDPESISEYGFSAADITALNKEIDDFEKVIENPSGAIAIRKALTAALRPHFREVLNILLSMDRLVLRFRNTPEGKTFADNWKASRVVRNLGHNNPTPDPEPDPEPPTA